MNKEVKDLIRQLKRVPGVTVSRGTHPKVSYKGDFVVSLPGTPSDVRWRRNALAALKRAGVDLDADHSTRAANGQPPPPPIGKENSLSLTTEQITLRDAAKIMEAVTGHFNLVVREGRVWGHGSTERLADALVAYSIVHDAPIPARHYITHPEYNSDIEKLALLGSKRVAQAGVAHVKNVENAVVTNLAKRDVVFAKRAWAWYIANEESAQEQLALLATAPADEIETEDNGEVGTPEDAVNGNGHVDVASDDLALRVLVKLIRGGEDEDEAIEIAKQIASR